MLHLSFFVLVIHVFFVPLASPKVLSLGNEKEKHVFFLHFSRFFCTFAANY